jgi:nucleoid-associated protein YgaU
MRALELTQDLERLLREEADLVELTEAQRAELAAVRARLEEAQSEVARLTGARGIYTVQRGDSLSYVAAVFYRNGFRWPAILAANAHLIDDPDLIFPGMVLIVPQ